MSISELSATPDAVPPVELGPIGPKARYEFTPVQEEVIGDLAGKMRFVGTFLCALALLSLFQVIYVAVKLQNHPLDIFTTINALIYGLIGYWTVVASRNFAAVVATTGWDVPHVMDALRSLRKMYSLLFYLLVAATCA